MTLPLGGYGRISRVGTRDASRLVSPDQQREAVERKAAAVNREMVWFGVDKDVSGAKAKRKILDEILDGIEAGRLGGMIVSRLDRFSRLKPRERVELIARIEDAGGVLLSAAENIDPSTPEGRFARDVFFGVARMEWERYKEGFDDAKTRALDRGVPLGPTPFWLERLADGTVRIHPQRGPAFQHALKLIPTQGLGAAARYLDEQGFAHDRGKREGKPYTFTASTLRRMAASPVLLGTSRYGETSIKIPALVSRREWESAQPNPAAARLPPAEFPLSGLASCGSCRNHLVGGRGGPDGRRMYRCAAGLATFKGTRCEAPAAISAELVEEHVRTYLAEVLRQANVAPVADAGAGDELDRVEREVADLEAKLDEITADTTLRDSIGPERFRTMAATLAGQIETAQARLGDLVRTTANVSPPAIVPELLESASLQELGGFLVAMLDDVIVLRGRSPVADRATVVLKGSKPPPGVARR